MNTTSIEWTDKSVNPIRAKRVITVADHVRNNPNGHFCQKISKECTFCYSSRTQPRFGMPEFPGVLHTPEMMGIEVYFDEAKLAPILRQKKPCRIFWVDMSDLFGSWVKDEWIDYCLAVMALTPHITHQILTKRPDRAQAYFDRLRNLHNLFHIADVAREHGLKINAERPPENVWPLPNVWVGCSVGYKPAKSRIDILRDIPAAVRYLSVEPLIESLGDLDLCAIDWVICGGESGPGARPMHPDWARSVRDQCLAQNVKFFFKQWGAWSPYRPERFLARTPRAFGSTVKPNIYCWGNDGLPYCAAVNTKPAGYNIGQTVYLVGKKAAGRMLDGRTWDEYPDVRQ